MDKTQKPGLAIESVHLTRCHIDDLVLTGSNSYGLTITHIDRELSSDNKRLTFGVDFDLMSEVTNPSFKFTCGFRIVYSRSDESAMTFDELKNHVAVAHLFPFLREFASNMTTRLPFPTLMVEPMNTHLMVARYEERKKASAGK